MSDQKNKQPQHGGKQNTDGKQSHDQSGQKTPSNSQGKSSDQHKSDQHKSNMRDTDEDKNNQIDDNPEETKKKIPNMDKKH
jgi:hypothetical protein